MTLLHEERLLHGVGSCKTEQLARFELIYLLMEIQIQLVTNHQSSFTVYMSMERGALALALLTGALAHWPICYGECP